MLSVLIPTYNEETVIESTVRSLYGVLSDEKIPHEILIIDDRSKDRTLKILQSLKNEIPSLRYETNMLPQGFGYSLRYGLSVFRGDSVCFFMADCAETPQDLVRFYRMMESGYDCVFGSRFIKGGQVTNYPPLKLILNRMANLFIRTLFWIKYNDTTNAFKLYRRSVIEGTHPLLSSHFNLTVELPLKAIIRGYKYAVLPNSWCGRESGISKLNIKAMGSRYLFIVLYCFIEKLLSGGDYMKDEKTRMDGSPPIPQNLNELKNP